MSKSAPPPDELRSERIWQNLVESRDDRGALEAGRRLGSWLLNDEAEAFLRSLTTTDSGRRRIELSVPDELAGFPWELATPSEGHPLGVDPNFTFVRVPNEGERQEWQPEGRLDVLLVGVQLEPSAGYRRLFSEPELETIRDTIVKEHGNAFNVEVDYDGLWDDLVSRCKSAGAPHIFHFAGHGLEDGGLVFRARNGGAAKVRASRLTNLLSLKQRRTSLVFLNACHTAASGGEARPLRSLATELHRLGIPAVIGIDSEIPNADAQRLAAHFYQGIGRGESVDVALQTARWELFMGVSEVSAWPFVVLSVNGAPRPLVSSANEIGEAADPSRLGFGEQHKRLRLLVEARRPTVIVVHGELRRGHRLFLERVQQELEQSKAVLWRPVANFQFDGGAEPLLQRSQLAAALAESLGESTEGTQAELENRIALALADRTEKCVLLIDIQHPIVPANEAEAAAVLSLVKELWVDLIRKARERRARLPVFLLIPLAYEPKRWLLGYTARARKTREVIENLVETPELDSNTAVEVLPELEPFTKQDLEDYFRLSCGMPLAEARALAEPMLRYRDNEAIFVGVKEAIKKWKSKNR